MLNVKNLETALRARFKSPRAALVALGIDAEAVLNSSSTDPGKHDFRVALEQLLMECKNLRGSELEKIFALLDEHVPFDKRTANADRDQEAEKDDRDLDDRGRGDEEQPDDDAESELRRFLEKKGLDPQAIDIAVGLRANAIAGGASGPAAMDGTMREISRLAGAIKGSPAPRPTPRRPVPTARQRASFAAMYPDGARIRSEA